MSHYTQKHIDSVNILQAMCYCFVQHLDFKIRVILVQIFLIALDKNEVTLPDKNEVLPVLNP